MNCHNFQSIADELARGRLMDAAQREDAHAHADACGACAARLADGRALTAGLRTLAAQSAGQEAPARVESALLATFRQRHAAAAPSQLEDAPQTNAPASVVVPLSSHRPRASLWRLPRWAQGAAVAAASVLLVVGLYGIFREQSQPATQLAQSGAQKSDALAGKKPDVQPAPIAGGGGTATDVAGDGSADVVEPGRRDPEVSTPRRNNRGAGARANFQTAKFNRGGARRPTNNAGADASAPEEIATNFFPLMNGGQLTPGDAGHVIRVEVPRTALASFGLPVNADRAGGRVKADVLMGEDGIARAIRFVQ